MDKTLKNIDVKAKRRKGRQKIDYTKPAYVYDTYEIYNLVTDYGLSFGKLNFRRFPSTDFHLLMGNFNNDLSINLDVRMNDYTFYRNYSPIDPMRMKTDARRSNSYIMNELRLARQSEVRLFTDFELRNEDQPHERSRSVADATIFFVTMPDQSERVTYRDRRIILHGMTEPADFYHPDYSQTPLPEEAPKDYRRTLYWNPNAFFGEDGTLTIRFFNNGSPTRIRGNAMGISRTGKPVFVSF